MIWIGLPAYNEQERIGHLLMDISKSLKRGHQQYNIVVYDDGSRDKTVQTVLAEKKHGVNVDIIEGKVNKGLAHALTRLIAHCTGLSGIDDVIIIMDADATHNPEHMNRMINYIRDGFDVIIASRYTPYSRMRGLAWHRRIFSNVANMAFRLLFPIRGIRDYTCAYRAYTSKILKLAQELYSDRLIEEDSFACMAELLIKLRKLDIIACEIPLILRYDKKIGPSKMNVAVTVLRTLNLFIKGLFYHKPGQEKLNILREKYHI